MSDFETQIDNKVLFVDDEPNILDAYKRQLRKKYQIETALGGEKGLELIKNNGPYAVVVSDLRMPEMDGNVFLSRVKEMVPECVRIMLTGHADLKTALHAINESNIFRLLTKPCTPQVLGETLEAGIEQYGINLKTSENDDPDRLVVMSKKILIVDDDPVILRMLTACLRVFKDLAIMTADDGKSALEILKKEPVDLLITDLNMPEMNGLKLLSYMKKNQPEIPVIVLTAFGQSELEEKIKGYGNLEYYEKPLDINVFKETILKRIQTEPNSQIHGIGTASFLQLIDMEEKDCTLMIRSSGNLGYLYFSSGELIAAKSQGKRGEEAAFEIINWDNSSIEIRNTCPKREKEINKPLMYILMESARLKDESKTNIPQMGDTQKLTPGII
jgi:DNA-binding NtrC family response regulator